MAKVSASALLVKVKATAYPVKDRTRVAHPAATTTAAHAVARHAAVPAMARVTVPAARHDPRAMHRVTPVAHAATAPPVAHAKIAARVKTEVHAKKVPRVSPAPTPIWAAGAAGNPG